MYFGLCYAHIVQKAELLKACQELDKILKELVKTCQELALGFIEKWVFWSLHI